jgi:hypothetical protein
MASYISRANAAIDVDTMKDAAADLMAHYSCVY